MRSLLRVADRGTRALRMKALVNFSDGQYNQSRVVQGKGEAAGRPARANDVPGEDWPDVRSKEELDPPFVSTKNLKRQNSR